ACRSAAQPSEENDDENRRNEWTPPFVEPECFQRRRAALHEQHDRAGPGERADEVEDAELRGMHPGVGAGDGNRRAQSGQKAADEHQTCFTRVHVLDDAIVVMTEYRKAVEQKYASELDLEPQLSDSCTAYVVAILDDRRN